MKDLLKSLKEKHLIAVEQHDLLKHNFNNVSKHLFADQMKNSKGDSRLSNRYSPETKQFAMTLHYYSPKAYEIQSAVLEQIGVDVFPSFRTHFYEHRIGHEMDHLSCLLRKISSNYLKMRLKTFGKKYSEMVVHKNEPSLRHQLTKTILFHHQ